MLVRNLTETRKYYLNTQEVESNCNAILFVNTGKANVFINGQKFTQNDFLSIGQDGGKVDESLYKINFQRSTYHDSIPNGYELTVFRTYNAKMTK